MWYPEVFVRTKAISYVHIFFFLLQTSILALSAVFSPEKGVRRMLTPWNGLVYLLRSFQSIFAFAVGHNPLLGRNLHFRTTNAQVIEKKKWQFAVGHSFIMVKTCMCE